MDDNLREDLADYAHSAWSGWMEYLFSRCYIHQDGWIFTKDSHDHWRRQMNTYYKDLPEKEKESDRKEADKMIEIFERHKSPKPDRSISQDPQAGTNRPWDVNPEVKRSLESTPHWPRKSEAFDHLVRDIPPMLAAYDAAMDRICELETVMTKITMVMAQAFRVDIERSLRQPMSPRCFMGGDSNDVKGVKFDGAHETEKV